MQIYLAPMEGITTFLYRNAFHRYYGGIDKYFTPFLSSRHLNHREINDVLPEHNEGLSLVPQILTNQADVFLEIAAQLKDYGYQEINLNLGCPSGTVTAKKRGAGFLSVPEQLDAFLCEIFEKCTQEISVKTRIGFSSLQEWEKLLSIFAKYPMKELIIHPRLATEFYNGTPHPEAFRLAHDMITVPLCYNGDIVSEASLQALTERLSALDATSCPHSSSDVMTIQSSVPEAMTAQNSTRADMSARLSALDAVMLGRGALSDPTLPSDIKKKSSAEAEDLHTPKELSTFKNFHDEILEGYLAYMSSEQPVLFRMKELWTYMGRYLSLTDKEMKQLRKVSRLADYRILVSSLVESRQQ